MTQQPRKLSVTLFIPVKNELEALQGIMPKLSYD